HYTYRVTWSSEDDEFVAACVEFPSLSWLASSQAEALTGLDDLIAETVADMQEQAETVPQPLSERRYSGKFNLRVGESLHRRLAIEAAEEQVSINQLVIRRLTVCPVAGRGRQASVTGPDTGHVRAAGYAIGASRHACRLRPGSQPLVP